MNPQLPEHTASAPVALLERLAVILQREFGALKERQLDTFEALQGEKEQLILELSRIYDESAARQQPGQDSPPLTPPREAELARQCRDLQSRNELLLQRKLSVVRSALQALHCFNQPEPLETYDRRGKVRAELPRLALTRL